MLTTTTAAVLEGPGRPFSLEQVELDDPRAEEVLVRMVAAGFCHTDLGVQAGHIPFALPGVIGHEGAGVVEAVGSAVTRVAPGDVAIDLVDHRLDVALELGATHRINPATENVAKALDRNTCGTGLDHAVDTTVDMCVLRTAVDALGTLGRTAAVGATAPDTERALEYQDLLVGPRLSALPRATRTPSR
ncbi:alcohol dehydrogenase catalytic domain-containing protein [Streptomyces cavernae]|uniref:alcohol dehydrogenase catalytic domain-containing protein n=1 Tax=Streptomyces cavernae TaxID=2259034 RepID=UPI0030B84F9F